MVISIYRVSSPVYKGVSKHEAVFVKFNKGLSAWKDLMGFAEKRNFKTKVIALIGAPGTIKSRLTNQIGERIYNGNTCYKPRGEWWDGYQEDTECVIINDFYGWLKYDELLIITDRYPYNKVPIKGAYINFRPKCIVITSNAEIRSWYKFNGYQTSAVDRRVDHLFIEDVPKICISLKLKNNAKRSYL